MGDLTIIGSGGLNKTETYDELSNVFIVAVDPSFKEMNFTRIVSDPLPVLGTYVNPDLNLDKSLDIFMVSSNDT